MKLCFFLTFCIGIVISANGGASANGMVVQTQIIMRCKAPMNDEVQVMLMERDLGGSLIDEDETFDYGKYYLNKVPEQRLLLQGGDFELSGLEPYLFIIHSCTNQSNTVKRLEVDLMEGMYKSRFFDVIIDLDTMKHTIKDTLISP